MKEKMLSLLLILVLALLCACTPAQRPAAPAAESEAVPAADMVDEPAQPPETAAPTPPESAPEASDEPGEPLSRRTPERVLASNYYTAELYTNTTRQYRGELQSRKYVVSDGVTATGYRATGVGRTSIFFDRTITENATVWYYDAATDAWLSQPLAEGTFTSPVVYLEAASGQSYFLALPRTYTLLENDTKLYHPEHDGLVRITPSTKGWRVVMEGSGLQDGRVCDALIVDAPFALVNWEKDNCAKAWVLYGKNGASQWCFDGYYRQSPSNYIPTGSNYYYCCVASYTIKHFLAKMPTSSEAAALTILMLDTMVQRQNSYGYWATEPGSEWLLGDFGIGPGFYDTRFNTDLLEILIKAERKFGSGMFTEPITRYVGFYLQLADASHISTQNGGWLIPDYWHPAELTAPHTSLNHQASECLALYHAADLLKRDDLRALADRLLKGIEDTGSQWVMSDHNLYYSRLPDGTYLTGDYPYLTYNDLYFLRKYLTGFGVEPNETLTYLMDEKLQWMKRNGVTGYETD